MLPETVDAYLNRLVELAEANDMASLLAYLNATLGTYRMNGIFLDMGKAKLRLFLLGVSVICHAIQCENRLAMHWADARRVDEQATCILDNSYMV